jgi:hypothetical protein
MVSVLAVNHVQTGGAPGIQRRQKLSFMVPGFARKNMTLDNIFCRLRRVVFSAKCSTHGTILAIFAYYREQRSHFIVVLSDLEANPRIAPRQAA